VKTWIVRGLTLAGALALGAALHFLLAPLGYAWVVWGLGGLVAALFALEMSLRARRRGRERRSWRRWRATIFDAPARERALAEIRRELDRARRLGPRLRVSQARLSVLLAELLLAKGSSREAIRVLSKIDLSPLQPLQAAAIRLARTQAYLHLGDVDGAASALTPFDGVATGDAVIDASVRLARGAVALEEGRVEEAEDAAGAILELAEPHDELWDDAVALKAACLEERDEPHEVTLRTIEAAGRVRIGALGTRRLRELVAALDPG